MDQIGIGANRRCFLEELQRLHQAGRLQFFGAHAALADARAFARWLAPLRRSEWVLRFRREAAPTLFAVFFICVFNLVQRVVCFCC